MVSVVTKPPVSRALLRGCLRHQAASQLLSCLLFRFGCSSQGRGQSQLLPVLLPLLPQQRCPGLLSSLLNPPGLAVQLLSQLCKKLRTSSHCQLRERLCFSLFQ